MLRFAPECADGVPEPWNAAAEYYYGLRAKHLEACHNITAYGAERRAIDTGEFHGGLDSEADIAAMADRLERILKDYLAATSEPGEWSVVVYESAVRWLRFWQPHGFLIAADF